MNYYRLEETCGRLQLENAGTESAMSYVLALQPLSYF
jgi:hypothetical protein